jgi:hypothetical protein
MLIVTILAVLVIVIALLYRLSPNERAIQQSTLWIKRTIIAWALICGLGTIITYAEELLRTGGFTKW